MLAAAGFALACCSSPESYPPDWIEISIGSLFELRAPPGTEVRPGKGADSLVGTIDGPSFQLSFDYGLYSNPLDGAAGEPGRRVREVRIDAVDARLVTFRVPGGPGHFIGIHFPEIQESAPGKIRLTVTCELENEEAVAVVEKIYRSIRFHTR